MYIHQDDLMLNKFLPCFSYLNKQKSKEFFNLKIHSDGYSNDLEPLSMPSPIENLHAAIYSEILFLFAINN